ncbi:MAG: fatty acid desaturase [Polyangiaceae bacterium]
MRTFAWTRAPEPHAVRRRRLLRQHPEIRRLNGFDRRTALVAVLVAITQLALAAGIAHLRERGSALGSYWLIVPFSYAVGATLTHWLSMAIHETSHQAAARTRWGNTLVGLIANVPLFVPVAVTFCRYHLDHHRKLGSIREDTDIPLRWEVRHIGSSTWRKAVWLFLHPLVYFARGLTFAKPFNLGEWLNVAMMVGVNAAIYQALGPAALAYLFLSFYFAHGLHPVAGHFIHEHYTFAPGQETFSYYGPLNLVTFNVGYHNEHHDFMGIPGWRLPELRRMVPEYGELVSHRSWTGVLWRFITDPTMGYASRIVRESASPSTSPSASPSPAPSPSPAAPKEVAHVHAG